MSEVIDEEQRRRAKFPHELFMVNLGAHLLLGPLAIFLEIGRLGLLIPIGFSALIIAYSYWRTGQAQAEAFVHAHWQLALRRYRLLMLAYLISAVLIGIGWLLSFNIDPASPQKFLPVALTRIGVMPTVLMVLACFVLENGALGMALRGESPKLGGKDTG